jgi:hypothetical protein
MTTRKTIFNQYLGPQWQVHGEQVGERFYLYARNLRSSEQFNVDPDTGHVDKPGLPEKVLRTMMWFARDLPTSDNFINRFTTWLFKWDSRDFAWELAAGDWDSRDVDT